MSSVSRAVILSVLVVYGTETATANGPTCGKPKGVVLGGCTNGYQVDSKCADCRCDVGYIQKEERKNNRLQCVLKRYSNGTETGRWKGKILQQCQKLKDCVVPDIANVTVARSIVKHGDWVHIKCAPGHFQTYGVNQSLCHDGEFQSSLHDVACYVVHCGFPRGSDWPEDARIVYFGSHHPVYKFSYDSLLTYKCNDGFKLSGRKSRRCLANGKWAGKPPRCEAIPEMCPAAIGGPRKPLPVGAIVSRPSQCTDGLAPISRSTTWTCSKGGKWERFPATTLCIRPCNPPPEIRRARLVRTTSNRSRSFGPGEEVIYKCKGTTQVGGNATRRCYDGIWQGTNIICARKSTCKPYELKNGQATPRENSLNSSRNKYRDGNVIVFDCFSGYQINGSTQATCKASRWRFSEGRPPRCNRSRPKRRRE